MNINQKRSLIIFVIRFLALFSLFYFGTLLMIGLAAPGGYYSPVIAAYFDYVSWLKLSYMKAASLIAAFFGYETVYEPGFLIRVVKARGVIVAYDCVGYGVMSFWAAFILSAGKRLMPSLKWLLGGLLILWLINSLRIGLFLVAINKKWPMPFGFDHHTWFNIFAYGAIFAMIYVYEKNQDIRL